MTVAVLDSPVTSDAVRFSQFKAVVSGKVSCLSECGELEILLKAQSEDKSASKTHKVGTDHPSSIQSALSHEDCTGTEAGVAVFIIRTLVSLWRPDQESNFLITLKSCFRFRASSNCRQPEALFKKGQLYIIIVYGPALQKNYLASFSFDASKRYCLYTCLGSGQLSPLRGLYSI